MQESPKVLYIGTPSGTKPEAGHLAKSAGIARYAEARGWNVVPVAWARDLRRKMPAIIREEHPAGCIVECSAALGPWLPPPLFAGIPTVWLEPAGAPFFLAELLSVRNGGDRPLPFDAVFFRVMPLDREGAEAARGDDAFEPPKEGQPTPIPPMLWRPWRSGAWILPDGTALGLLSPRQTGVQIRFWKDSALHADAEMRYPYRKLAPAETWAPEHRPFVIGGTASGGESGWREFCNEVKRIENTAR